MAGSLVTTPATTDPEIGDWQNFIAWLEKAQKGRHNVNLSEYDTTAEPVVAAGSILEIGGALYVFNSDESITGWAAIADSTQAYIKFVPDGSDVTVEFTDVAPTWSDSKLGWYDGVDRYLFAVYKDGSGNYARKRLLLSKAEEQAHELLVQTLTTMGVLDAQGGIANSAGNLSLSDAVAVTGALTVSGASTFNGNVTVAAGKDLSVGDDLTVTDDASVGGDLTVTGTSNLNGNVNVGVDLDVTGDVTCDNTGVFQGSLTTMNKFYVEEGINVSGQYFSSVAITAEDIFEALKGLIPNNNNTLRVTGCIQKRYAPQTTYHIVGARRVTSTRIDLFTYTPDSAIAGTHTLTDGDTSTDYAFAALAW